MDNSAAIDCQKEIKAIIQALLTQAGASSTVVDNDLADLLWSSIERATETVTTSVQEESGGDDPLNMGMIIVRHGRRTAKSIHFRNFSADTTLASHALLTALTGSPAIAATLSIGVVGATFLPFVIGVAFTLWKSLEKTIGWPEACLFFALHEEASFTDFVSYEVANNMGSVLKNRFGYAKGTNTNELDDLLDKLVAHGALQRDVNGFRLMEGVRNSWVDWDA
jgi:hypothetical protein